MTFVFPLLLGGLVLTGIPVLLHLIVRQKPKRLPFPAFRFLVQQQRSNLRKLRLRHLLLLALRIFLIAAMCLLLARPRLFHQVLGLDGERPVQAVLVVDTSASMEYRSSDGKTRLAQAQERGHELLNDLPAGSQVAIVDSAGAGQSTAGMAVRARGAQAHRQPQNPLRQCPGQPGAAPGARPARSDGAGQERACRPGALEAGRGAVGSDARLLGRRTAAGAGGQAGSPAADVRGVARRARANRHAQGPARRDARPTAIRQGFWRAGVDRGADGAAGRSRRAAAGARQLAGAVAGVGAAGAAIVPGDAHAAGARRSVVGGCRCRQDGAVAAAGIDAALHGGAQLLFIDVGIESPVDVVLGRWNCRGPRRGPNSRYSRLATRSRSA